MQHISLADWAKWIVLVHKHYRIQWYNGKTKQDETTIDFDIIMQFWKGNHDLRSTANVFLDEIQVNAHFFQEHVIENDIDPREFQTIEDHQKLMQYSEFECDFGFFWSLDLMFEKDIA